MTKKAPAKKTEAIAQEAEFVARTAVLGNWIRTRKHLITGVEQDADGKRTKIYTNAKLWGDFPSQRVAFEGKTECMAINQMKAFIAIFNEFRNQFIHDAVGEAVGNGYDHANDDPAPKQKEAAAA